MDLNIFLLNNIFLLFDMVSQTSLFTVRTGGQDSHMPSKLRNLSVGGTL